MTHIPLCGTHSNGLAFTILSDDSLTLSTVVLFVRKYYLYKITGTFLDAYETF